MATVFDLAIAAVQFSAVDSLVQAMRAVDRNAERFHGEGCCEQTATTLSPTEPAACFEPRPVIHPTPRYEPRPVFHPRPRFAAPRLRAACPTLAPIVQKPPEELPLQPPWKTVPWENPTQPAQVIKLACYRPDMNRKGLLIDSFI